MQSGCTKKVPYGQPPANAPILDERYTTADQRYSVLVRYIEKPARANGKGNRPQHWMVMITELPDP